MAFTQRIDEFARGSPIRSLGVADDFDADIEPGAAHIADSRVPGGDACQFCSQRGAHFGEALEIEPGYRLAELLLELVRRGSLCGWAARKDAAWQKFGPDAA